MDGLVGWEEYKAEEYDFGDEPVDLSDPEVAEEWKLMEEDRFLFMAADVSGDGALDVREFLSFSHPEEDPAMRPHVLAQVLKEKDLDGDGALSFQEYVGDRGQGKDKEWIVAWIIPSNEEIATDEVDHLFSGADENGNEQLTFEEVLNNHDLFVGSEATDYGDHLH